MARGVTIDLDIEAEMAVVWLEAGELALQGAEMIAEELRAAIPHSDIPSAPGQPPHSSGRLLESIKSAMKARRKGDRIFANAYTLLTLPGGASLLLSLDQGLEHIAPRPVIEAAVRRAGERLQARVQQVNQQFRLAR